VRDGDWRRQRERPLPGSVGPALSQDERPPVATPDGLSKSSRGMAGATAAIVPALQPVLISSARVGRRTYPERVIRGRSGVQKEAADPVRRPPQVFPRLLWTFAGKVIESSSVEQRGPRSRVHRSPGTEVERDFPIRLRFIRRTRHRYVQEGWGDYCDRARRASR